MPPDRPPLPPLQKHLQHLGAGSKHRVRRAIAEGRVTVDGEVVTRFAEPVEPGSRIEVDGEAVGFAPEDGEDGAPRPGPRTVLLMHKPKKHVTALEDAFGRDALGRYLPEDLPRVFPVGRLDYNSEGALLLTNDGRLARRVLHPDWHLPKRYGVKIRGHLEEGHPGLARIAAGLTLPDVTYRPVEVRLGERRTRATWVEMVLTEGKSRQIRRSCRAVGLQIVKLRRLAIGPVELGDLKPRCVRPLTDRELVALDAAVGLKVGLTVGLKVEMALGLAVGPEAGTEDR